MEKIKIERTDEIVYHHKLPPVLPDLKWNYI